MKTANWTLLMASAVLLFLAATVSCDRGSAPDTAPETPTAAPDVTTAKAALTPAEMKNLVRRSYQYVALFNTLNNFAVNAKNPFATGGWNKTHYPQGLMDASVRAVSRQLNSDTKRL